MPEAVQRLKLSGPAEMVSMVPHLFGYTPKESIVLIGLYGENGRLGTSMRMDFPSYADAEETVKATLEFMDREPPDRVVLIYYPGEGLVSTGELNDLYQLALLKRNISCGDAIVIKDGRWTSLQCSNPECCPLGGTPIDQPEAVVAGAMSASLGLPQPVASREELVANVAVITGAKAKTMAKAIDRAVETQLKALTSATEEEIVALLDGLKESLPARVDQMVKHFEAGSGLPPLSNAEVAWLLVALTPLGLRDVVIEHMIAHKYDAPYEDLLLYCTRHAVDNTGAVVSTMAGVVAWQLGSGTRARIAVDRALVDDPGYRLALLLEQILDTGMPPSTWMRMKEDQS